MVTTIHQTVARLISAGVQLPVFLVIREGPNATYEWSSTEFELVAERWHTAFPGAQVQLEVHDLVSRIASAMASVLNDFVNLRFDGATTRRQRRHVIWDMQRRVIVDWLQHATPRELDLAAEAWRQHLGSLGISMDEDMSESHAWDFARTVPRLASLRAVLARHMADPPTPDANLGEIICGLHLAKSGAVRGGGH